MLRKLLLLLIAAVTVAALPGPAFANEFVVRCLYHHTSNDDPIVYHGTQGYSHSHDFFGNHTTNYNSTYNGTNPMLGQTSSCVVSQDTAGYWAPTPYIPSLGFFHDHGKSNGGDDFRAYYTCGDGAPTDCANTKPIPANLKLTANRGATKPPDMQILKWFCGANNQPGQSTPMANHPYDCGPYAKPVSQGGNGFCGPNGCGFVDGVVGIVQFPQCLPKGYVPLPVGAGSSGDDTPNAAYEAFTGTKKGQCDTSHTLHIPDVSTRFHFGVMDPCDGAAPCGPTDNTQGAKCSSQVSVLPSGCGARGNITTGNIQLQFSEGSNCTALPSGCGRGEYWTLHSDFWNTWKQSGDPKQIDMVDLTKYCLQQGVVPPMSGYPTTSCGFLPAS